MTLKRSQFLQNFVLPNVYFHTTACYLTLRNAGVPLGKIGLWQPTDLDGAWALTESAVQHWGEALLECNHTNHYVDPTLLQQRIRHIQRQWRAWQASGQAITQVKQLFA